MTSLFIVIKQKLYLYEPSTLIILYDKSSVLIELSFDLLLYHLHIGLVYAAKLDNKCVHFVVMTSLLIITKLKLCLYEPSTVIIQYDKSS